MKSLYAAILVCIAQPAIAANSLCDQAEQVVFSCAIKGSSKWASLCSSANLTAKVGYLQYRFGRRGNVELEYPQEKTNSPRKFKFAHYFRSQVDRTEVGFENHGYRYTIYDYYDGEEDEPAKTESGIRIESPRGKPKELICSGRPANNLAVLETALPCDKTNALAMGCN